MNHQPTPEQEIEDLKLKVAYYEKRFEDLPYFVRFFMPRPEFPRSQKERQEDWNAMELLHEIRKGEWAEERKKRVERRRNSWVSRIPIIGWIFCR